MHTWWGGAASLKVCLSVRRSQPCKPSRAVAVSSRERPQVWRAITAPPCPWDSFKPAASDAHDSHMAVTWARHGSVIAQRQPLRAMHA